jgi:hypothetical protein
VDLPPSSKPIGCKWVFRRKYTTDGSIQAFKARLVAKGFRQKEGIYYFDTYAPVARITSIRVLMTLASIYNLYVHQMDIKTTILNGDLDEKVYMEQPEEFVLPQNEKKVCKLVKSLYDKHQNNGMKSLIMLFYLMDSNIMELTSVFIQNSQRLWCNCLPLC